MRVGFLSSYPPAECGIATYTQYLTDAMREFAAELVIVCHQCGAGPDVFPSFHFEDPNLAEKAYQTMVRLAPDVVHIQHEYGLYGRHEGVSIVPLIIQLRQTDLPVVTTIHTVYEEIRRSHRDVLHAIVEFSDRVIVHESFQRETLARNFGVSSVGKIEVIPHGARLVDKVPEAKARLGIPDGQKVILVAGYMRPSKNFELVIDILPDILRGYPDAVLVFASKARQSHDLDYRDELLRKIADSPVRDRIRLIGGPIPQRVFDLALSAADIVILPYHITAQSGIVAHCLAFGRPLVLSDSLSLRKLVDRCEAGFICSNDGEFVEAAVRLLSDEGLAARFSENAVRYVREQISWPLIARQTYEVYRSLVNGTFAAEINTIEVE